jgi:dTDP-4-amino-4,6-dideoxygalactose transaminase
VSWRVPLVEVVLSEQDIDAYLNRLRSGWLTMGPFIEQFEADLCPSSRLRTPFGTSAPSPSSATRPGCFDRSSTLRTSSGG